MARTGGMVPTAFEASVTATSRVLGESTAPSSSRSRVQSSRRTPTQRTATPRSSASANQGATFASWSRRVTTSSSEGPSTRPMARLTANVMEVMLGPNEISPGSVAPRKSAAAAWTSSSIASVSRLAAKAPWRLAFDVSR